MPQLNSTRREQLRRCLQKLGLSASVEVDWQQLDRALTHASASPEDNYEHLEFLGDAALRLAAAEFLLETYSEASVGELAAVRSRLVSDHTLALLADQLSLEPYLLVSSSAWGDKAGRNSRLADTFEAVLGALYSQTHDLSLIRPWLDAHFKRLAEQIRQDPTRQNYKAALQELTQAYYQVRPDYRVQEISQQHGDPERFEAEVWLQEKGWGVGRGPSIKQAEQVAAKVAFRKLQAQLSSPSDVAS
ncbi:Ribonuclease [Halomicronema hongdechloris C2206]|uniref:Ribonuclease 3 n=1 Tax=Halomicronema hongdechloris C2206 TaxID=1641165 RepID=A0A1Z3HHK9_9CYAN|nr:ribonuclease III [Halomicronema hongdechloris]ASC69697.1 Ribonuclease [Halomicronema hongdechloris C2206]